MLDFLHERLANINESEIAGIILVNIAIIQSIKKTFNLTSKKTVYLLTVIISLCAYLWLLFKGVLIIDLFALFIAIIGGATGIYNFIPSQKTMNIDGGQTLIHNENESLGDK